MVVRLTRERSGIEAKGVFDIETGSLTVLSGSIVSADVRHTNTFRGADTIEERRIKYVENRTVVVDVLFKSPSTAANFVTGGSTNGLTAWKTEDGKSLKDVINEKNTII